MAVAKDKDAPARTKARASKSGKPKDAPAAAANRRLAQQTRKLLAKHYASKYKTGPR